MMRINASTASVRRAASAAIRRYSSEVATQAEKPVATQSAKYWYYQHKKEVMKGPRFEQTDMSAQPAPMPAIDLIAEQPVQKVHQRVVACNGGGGPLGHPKVYINLDQPGNHSCSYCGLRFEQEHHHH
ncbi:hypothetical protein GGF31_002982 [Allomyces arbusculus]|nr:hypothetical protein GGF31_002982 [Allomyces arbusculus]